jgi:hypothetical protein
MRSLIAAGRGLPAPLRAAGLLDTGSNVTCVAKGVVSGLGITPVVRTTTQTFAGPVPVDLYEVSVSVTQPGWTAGPSFVVPDVDVMEYAQTISRIDAVIGLDVLLQCQLIIDGPAMQFSLSF